MGVLGGIMDDLRGKRRPPPATQAEKGGNDLVEDKA
jgi:hypothetical protein